MGVEKGTGVGKMRPPKLWGLYLGSSVFSPELLTCNRAKVAKLFVGICIGSVFKGTLFLLNCRVDDPLKRRQPLLFIAIDYAR